MPEYEYKTTQHKPTGRGEIRGAVLRVKKIVNRRRALLEAIRKRRKAGKSVSRQVKRKKEMTKQIATGKRKIKRDYGGYGLGVMQYEGIYKRRK